MNIEDKKYQIRIGLNSLKWFGPSLYTNIYYVLSELIANAYDADAKNIYITQEENCIRFEDDGRGMSYEDIKKIYLNVGIETRVSEDDARTPGNRIKMGRKGIGKLAALAVSYDVDIMTMKDGDKSGFELSSSTKETNEDDDNILEPIKDDDIVFKNITEHGTAIIMKKELQYKINGDLLDTVKPNILRMFPIIINKDFRIHIKVNENETIIDSIDENIMGQLGTLITLGEEYHHLGKLVPEFSKSDTLKLDEDFKAQCEKLVDPWPAIVIPIELPNKQGITNKYSLEIKGWIGTRIKIKSPSKYPPTEFPQNFISLFANGKLGENNILPSVSTNRMPEAYIVGQLHIDLFELTELPDMASSNRQGYKTEDIRYQKVVEYVKKELVPAILKKRVIRRSIEKKLKEKEEYDELTKYGDEVQQKIGDLNKKIRIDIKRAIDVGYETKQEVEDVIEQKTTKEIMKLFNDKKKLDATIKKILISHAYDDQKIATILYDFLLYNNVPPEDILFSNAIDGKSRIPEEVHIYEYLKDWFVKRFANEKIHVLFLTSENQLNSRGATLEVGAAWVTKRDHSIFNIDGHRPSAPLDTAKAWIDFKKQDNAEGIKIILSKPEADKFCSKIEYICTDVSYSYKVKTREENIKYLNNHTSVIIE